jgi:flavin reductase (DIM6/NTAB) family NADH-FMN oxidoreductase RutF
MNQSSAPYGRGVSEIEATGLQSEPARLVDAPRLIDAPSALECLVTDIFQPSDKSGKPVPHWVVLGEVVGVHINDRFLTGEGRFDAKMASLMARCGYMDYAVADHIVAKPRPKAP